MANTARIQEIIVINKELTNRLKNAVGYIKEIDQQNKTIKRNLKRAREAVLESEQTAKKSEGIIASLKTKIGTLISENAKIRSQNSDLESSTAILKETIDHNSKEIEALQVGMSSKIAELKKIHAEEISMHLMHIAGIEAQITVLREKHPGSVLLRDSGEVFSDGRPKTKLRRIYEMAFDESKSSTRHPGIMLSQEWKI
jgi:chromosome segregation ATPase